MSRYFVDASYYFITVPTLHHQKFFTTNEKKSILLKRILTAKTKYQIKNLDFGIISSHYHLLGYFTHWRFIPEFLNFVNGGSSFDLNRIEGKQGRKIWDEYHLYFIDNEELLFKVRGYVVGNPYKHGEVISLADLEKYPFTTFGNLISIIGKEQAENIVTSVIKMHEGDLIKEFQVTLAKASTNNG